MKMLDVLIEEFEVVEDPRVSGRTKHMLLDILVIGVLAVICGAETWEEIHDFGIARLEWLKRFVDLSSGIPSHDTFLRVFSIINPKHFELAFMNWVQRIRTPDPGEPDLIAIDGKTICGTNFRKAGGYANPHLVSAWSTQHCLVLGQARAKGRGSAEYSAAIEILDALELLSFVGAYIIQAKISHPESWQEMNSSRGIKNSISELWFQGIEVLNRSCENDESEYLDDAHFIKFLCDSRTQIAVSSYLNQSYTCPKKCR